MRGLSADIAVIDAAYPSEEDGAAMRERFLAKAEELLADGAPLILPVPRFGRGLSMAVALRERTGDRSFSCRSGSGGNGTSSRGGNIS